MTISLVDLLWPFLTEVKILNAEKLFNAAYRSQA
jgi:hypothetical protein